MNENTTTLANEMEDVVEAAAPVAAEAGKAIAEYKITTGDKILAGGVFGLAIVGLGAIGYFGYKGGKKIYTKIKKSVAEAKAEVQEEIPETVEVTEEPKVKKAKKAE